MPGAPATVGAAAKGKNGAKPKGAAAALPPSGPLQRDRVWDGLGGALGIEEPRAALERSELGEHVARRLTGDAIDEGALTLSLRGLQLGRVPCELATRAPWLRELDVSSCRLTNDDLAPIVQLADLRALNASDNALVGMLTVALPPSLEELCLDGNGLTELPAAACALRHLQWLSLARNRVASLPPAAFSSWRHSLWYLDVRGNALTALPESIGECALLEELHAACNRLTALPDALGGCAALVALDVAHNALVALPDALGGCTALVEVNACGNALAEVAPSLLAGATRLEMLLLAGNRLTALPPQVGCASGLRVLSLAGNAGLRELPDELGALGALQEVYLSGCGVGALPDSTGPGWAAAVRCVCLRNTKLKALPPGVGEWGAVTLLDTRASAKGKRDTCRVPPETLHALAARGCRVVGALPGKAKKKKK